MEVISETERDDINRLAFRALDGSQDAKDQIIHRLMPRIKNMAMRNVRAASSMDKDDYVQIGALTVLDCLAKWSRDKWFIFYALTSAHWAMTSTRGDESLQVKGSTWLKGIRREAFKLQLQKGHAPSYQEIREAFPEDNRPSLSVIAAAVGASEPPRHLDKIDVTHEDAEDRALVYEDEYSFEADDDGADPETKVALRERILMLIPDQRRLIKRYLETGGDIQTLAEESGYSEKVTNERLRRILNTMARADLSSPKYERKLAIAKALARVEDCPELLDTLSERQKIYFQGLVEGCTYRDIARKHEVSGITVASAIEKASKKLSTANLPVNQVESPD